ncbi:bifunctional hydroxymethylpyrimidine kinase/phosphomethylpyrimidine kinase [Shewanella cyperi]|uniref:Thiamine-phosphate synthase n=1 Tax=Shewanella cyperi TaxID=2814292 RepID=A0A975ALM2_9GAMM|nr:bifunctional hydroxymethylpyrimidine kinase/phosphomethylpyrimidine kinase [Shewanella cyperi]QSX31602.1 bifunctional hydroxymethylpyrimidine kinase/phosphomethylpyrimidine kinase [Shewanella cyperi]
MEAKAKSIPEAFKKPIVWTIAGSDSGGGAGIQADLATINALGCHCCTIITALTAQSSVAVTLVEPVSDAMLLAQLNTLLADMPPAAIKIGLLANQAQLNMLVDWLTTHVPQVAVVLDPVMVASCGDTLQQGCGRLDFSPLFELATIITPNVAELAQMTGKEKLQNEVDWHQAATTLKTRIGGSLFAKGGDLPRHGRLATEAEDLMLLGELKDCSPLHSNMGFKLTSPRVQTDNNHGSGCTLASAAAAFLALGYVVPDALVLAKAYINRALALGYRSGAGPGPLGRPGWPESLEDFPAILPLAIDGAPKGQTVNEVPFATLEANLGIYPVVADIEQLKVLLKAGGKTIQFRLKQAATPGSEAELAVIRAIELGREYGAQLFINDHWQLALEHGAFGVHLGQEDLAGAPLGRLAEAGLALGLSSHGYFEALLALAHQPSYLALGHIFPTPTKTMPSKPQGLERLRRYVATFAPRLPTVAIGGIDKHNLVDIRATGVNSAAVVRAICAHAEPGKAFAELTALWEDGHGTF